MRSDAAVDVLRTITIWVYAGLSPADAYEGLIGVRPWFEPSWADIQDLACDLRRRLPEHAAADAPPARSAQRACLRCGETSASRGPGNRICARCRASEESIAVAYEGVAL